MPSRRDSPATARRGVSTKLLLLIGTIALASACGGGTDTNAVDPAPTGRFELVPGGIGTLVEGAADALFVPVRVEREAGVPETVELSIEAATPADAQGLQASLVATSLAPGENETGVLLRLPISDLPIFGHVRRLRVLASAPSGAHRLTLDVRVDPTDAPDVYLLAGQSNMVGFSGDGTRQPLGADASDPRILQLNVSPNEAFAADAPFRNASDYTAYASNVLPPPLVIAQDPLHQPAAARDGSVADTKAGEYIGLGLSFAKAALARTSADVVLVPAAWSGSAFCANADGPPGQWNAGPVDDVPGGDALGNTLLFDRAVARADAALAESGGVLRGILWHQGESDANEACAPTYGANLARLARELRRRIAPDRRGAALRAPDAPIPFVAGTLSRGADERGDLSMFNEPKRTVDDAIRALPSSVAHAAVSVHEDLVPAAGFPCGNDSCIHFGAQALREMGRRYDDALQRALAGAGGER